jgi:hypothetical protein
MLGWIHHGGGAVARTGVHLSAFSSRFRGRELPSGSAVKPAALGAPRGRPDGGSDCWPDRALDRGRMRNGARRMRWHLEVRHLQRWDVCGGGGASKCGTNTTPKRCAGQRRADMRLINAPLRSIAGLPGAAVVRRWRQAQRAAARPRRALSSEQSAVPRQMDAEPGDCALAGQQHVRDAGPNKCGTGVHAATRAGRRVDHSDQWRHHRLRRPTLRSAAAEASRIMRVRPRRALGQQAAAGARRCSGTLGAALPGPQWHGAVRLRNCASSCNSGFDGCDRPLNGCEANLERSNHCQQCSIACGPSGTPSARVESAASRITRCGDCDASQRLRDRHQLGLHCGFCNNLCTYAGQKPIT